MSNSDLDIKRNRKHTVSVESNGDIGESNASSGEDSSDLAVEEHIEVECLVY